MKRRNYDEASVVRALSKKASININTVSRTIEILKDNNDVGNGSWGKIDYLRKCHGYVAGFVAGLSKKKPVVNNDYDFTDDRRSKKQSKLNMTSMVKNVMKGAKTK